MLWKNKNTFKLRLNLLLFNYTVCLPVGNVIEVKVDTCVHTFYTFIRQL